MIVFLLLFFDLISSRKHLSDLKDPFGFNLEPTKEDFDNNAFDCDLESCSSLYCDPSAEDCLIPIQDEGCDSATCNPKEGEEWSPTSDAVDPSFIQLNSIPSLYSYSEGAREYLDLKFYSNSISSNEFRLKTVLSYYSLPPPLDLRHRRRRGRPGSQGVPFRSSPRSWSNIDGITLHQTGDGHLNLNDPDRLAAINCHAVVLRNGQIVILHEPTVPVAHGHANSLNLYDIGIEVDCRATGMATQTYDARGNPERIWRTFSLSSSEISRCSYILYRGSRPCSGSRGDYAKLMYKMFNTPGKRLEPTSDQLIATKILSKWYLYHVSNNGGRIHFIHAHRQGYGRKARPACPGENVWKGVAVSIFDRDDENLLPLSPNLSPLPPNYINSILLHSLLFNDTKCSLCDGLTSGSSKNAWKWKCPRPGITDRYCDGLQIPWIWDSSSNRCSGVPYYKGNINGLFTSPP